jgi:hypothetical protein
MKLFPLLAPAVFFAAGAYGQQPAPRPDQLPPLQQQWQQQGVPPIQQAPPGLIPPSRDMFQNANPSPAIPPPPMTADRPNTWLPASTVKLQALDKVNAQTAALTVKVGSSASFGSLTITAKACVVRPADQPADSAAFLTVTDSHPDSPGFNGWMLQIEPSVSMMEHPIYDLRVIGCS